MAENSKPAAKRRRGRGRPFQKGQSGNPGGRAKKLEELTVKCREFTDEIADRLRSIALRGEDKDSIAAAKLLWSYGYGNPAQVITGAGGAPLVPDSGIVELLRGMIAK